MSKNSLVGYLIRTSHWPESSILKLGFTFSFLWWLAECCSWWLKGRNSHSLLILLTVMLLLQSQWEYLSYKFSRQSTLSTRSYTAQYHCGSSYFHHLCLLLLTWSKSLVRSLFCEESRQGHEGLKYSIVFVIFCLSHHACFSTSISSS